MNISASEIMLIALLALVLFGPKRLPEIGRQVGRAIAEVRKVSRQFEREVKEAIEPLEREARQAMEPFERGVRDAEAQARETYKLAEDFSSFDMPDNAKTPAKPPAGSPEDPAET